MDIRVYPPEEIVEATVNHLPLSKSISARALILGALTENSEPIAPERLADCNDITVLKDALATRNGDIYCGDSGTAMRFLTAFYASQPDADVSLYGSERLSQRPIAPLVDALQALGADIAYVDVEGHLPVHIRGRQLAGGYVSLNASASSQFASALAMIAPTMAQPLQLDLGGEIASMPYLQMTLRMLGARGVDSHREAYTFHIDNAKLEAVEPECEPDWSAASYWYEIAAATAGWVTLPAMVQQSLQGDSILAKIGDRFGVITNFEDGNAELSATPDLHARLDMDMADYPDLVPALAVACCLVALPFHFSGLENLRHKESDRLNALCKELYKCGWTLRTDGASLENDGELHSVTEFPVLDTHGDHRLAMAFAAIAMWVEGVVIKDAEVVEKSYPKFWDDLAEAGFRIEHI